MPETVTQAAVAALTAADYVRNGGTPTCAWVRYLDDVARGVQRPLRGAGRG